ncbi:MAG: hypothetical protein JWN56_2231 [Sphingobacteriales bacterium]|nr:hypothetical protein [Sphingobacteriales bacterium]
MRLPSNYTTMFKALLISRYLILYAAAFITLIISCKKENSVTTDKNVRLAFSTDTILFDTIFTSIGSVTKRLKVYNHENQAIRISKINLEDESSSFKININGKAVNTDTNIELKANDSLYIYVKALIDPDATTLPFIVSGSLSFLTNGNMQVVHLQAYGQNANFINDVELNQSATWNNALPYVIYNSITVGENATLNIQKGTQIYFHKDARMIIAGTLNVTGELDKRIEFASDRKETIYQEEPGQWYGITFLKSSKGNNINYCVIKNAVFGIYVNPSSDDSHPKLMLTNSVIKNMESSALMLENTSAVAFNNLIYNCGQYLVYAVSGGSYNFKQNTFAAFNYNFSRSSPALSFSSNYLSASGSSSTNLLALNLTNNLIWGSYDNELFIDQKNLDQSLITISTNFVKYKSDFVINNSNILNKDPLFINARKENFRLSIESPALSKGLDLSTDMYFNPYLSKTLDGKTRTFLSDLGCF